LALCVCVRIFASKMAPATMISLMALPLVQSDDWGETSVTKALNAHIKRGDNGVYTGGKGLLLRNPFDTYETADFKVLPTTFWSNDLFAPSQLYPGVGGGGGNPMCPQDWCDQDARSGDNGPWNFAQTAYVVGDALGTFFADFENLQSNDWGWGVFYPSDSNAVDKRCRWLGDQEIYDCPGGYISSSGDFIKDDAFRGAGYYECGNPFAHSDFGGGAGCHFETWAIDQTDAVDGNGENMVRNNDCECNYNLKGDDGSWQPWFQNWLDHASHKSGFEYEWFSHGKAPSWALDVGMCWVNNLRDMINIQNQIFWGRYEWSSQQAPQSDYQISDPQSMRPYWGWNEIPMPTDKITNAKNWDAIVIKLPAAICGDKGEYDVVSCMGDGQQAQLHDDLIAWKDAGHMIPGLDHIGTRPGSYVVFAREYMDDSGNWFRYFFCQSWKKQWATYGVEIKYVNPNKGDTYGACYADNIQKVEEV